MSCTFGNLWICCESTATLALFLSCSFLQAPPCLIDAVSSCIHRHLCEHLKKQVRRWSSAQFLQSRSTWKVGCWGPVFLFLIYFWISKLFSESLKQNQTCLSDSSMHTHQSCFSKSWRMGWSWSASKSSNRAAISNWPVVWRGLGYLKIVLMFFVVLLKQYEWRMKKSPNLQKQSAKFARVTLSFLCLNVHIHPCHSSATMSKSRHPEEVVQQPKDPKSLVHLTLRTVSFWNWQTPLFFLHLSVFQKDAGNLFNPQNRIQWPRSNEHPVGSPSFPHGCSDRSLNTLVRSVIRPSHIPLGKRLPSQLFVKKLLLLKPKSEKRQTAGCSRNEVTRLVGGVVMRWGKPRWNHEISLFWFNCLESSMTDLWMWVSQNTHPRPKNQRRSYANRVFQIIFS